MKLKVLIIILAVLLVLYVVGVGMNGCSRDEVSDEPPGWVDRLGGEKPKPTLSADEVAFSTPVACKEDLAQGTITVTLSQPCVLSVTVPSGWLFRPSIRTLPLTLTQGTSARIDVDPLEPNRFNTQHNLPGASPVPQIFEQGGWVTIRCLSTPSCVFVR